MRVLPRPSMRFVGFIAAAVLFAGWLAGAESVADDELLETVDKHLYTAREDAIRLLEDALKQNPVNVSRWVALIHALNVNGETHFAERAARLALKTHPENPELLVARARVLGEAAAWDQLDDLGKLAGQEARAARLKELLSLQLLGAYAANQSLNDQARFHVAWAQRLLDRGHFEPVPEVVMEGLRISPKEPGLHALLPVAHVLAARYDQAMHEHARQDFKQTSYGPFVCLGDCLLFKRQPKLAIASFDGKTPDDAALRRILAMAHARLGEYAAAEELIGNSPVDDLLRLRWDLERGREAESKERVPDLLARHCRRGQGSWSAPTFAAWGGTVGEECRAGILWLNREFPDRHGEIYQAFGLADPQSVFRQPWLPAADVRVSARRYIAWLRASIPAAREEHRAQMRRTLAELLAHQQQYIAAAEALLPNVVDSANNSSNRKIIRKIDEDAVTWSLLHRRAAAEKLHQLDPWMLVRSRQLLAEIHCQKWNCSRIDRKAWRDTAEVVAELRTLSPGILADVLDDLEPKVISSADRTPYIALIECFGAVSDSPVLISALGMTSRTDSGGLISNQSENDSRSSDALHACLLKLSGVQITDIAPTDRFEFWTDWWRSSFQSIAESVSEMP